MKRTVKVVDSTFSHNPAIGYAGERQGEHPAYFHWDNTPGDARVKVFTDIRLREAEQDGAARKIALLLEPPSVNPGMYEWIKDHAGIFAAVLTHQTELVDLGHPFYFYPFGGSWIKEWGMFPKTKMVSMLVSPKKLTEGHRLRHEVAHLVDAYGAGVGKPVASKADALRDYRFAVIIENDTNNFWFTEKLIDCFSQGTIPVYRGCPGIGTFFDTDAMLLWDTVEELKQILGNLTVYTYNAMKKGATNNLNYASLYQCPEDWIHVTYGDRWWK